MALCCRRRWLRGVVRGLPQFRRGSLQFVIHQQSGHKPKMSNVRLGDQTSGMRGSPVDSLSIYRFFNVLLMLETTIGRNDASSRNRETARPSSRTTRILCALFASPRKTKWCFGSK